MLLLSYYKEMMVPCNTKTDLGLGLGVGVEVGVGREGAGLKC